MSAIVPGARVVGFHDTMFLGDFGVAAKCVLALHDVVEEIFAAKAVGRPVGDVVLRVEGNDLPDMTDEPKPQGAGSART